MSKASDHFLRVRLSPTSEGKEADPAKQRFNRTKGEGCCGETNKYNLLTMSLIMRPESVKRVLQSRISPNEIIIDFNKSRTII